MKDYSPNHYEQAFTNWLIDSRIRYILVDERKRAVLGRSNIKSFDCLLYSRSQQIIIAEIKGRKFKGTTFSGMAGFECWVTTDDIEGLANWQKIFGLPHIATFVFAYRIENIDVDFDGRDFYDFDSGRYVFFAVKLDDYCRFMTTRSPKWRTITLPADKFRRCAVPIQRLLQV